MLTCSYNRHNCSERLLKFFIDQDYIGEHLLLFYNNSRNLEEIDYDLDSLPSNKKIILINNYKDLQTGEEYKNTGAIFRDALSFIPDNIDIVSHMDVDDVYMPYHISEGVKGIGKAYKEGKKAYKPYYSYYWHSEGVEKKYNTHEPSFFIDASYLREKGYLQESVRYNQGWEIPLKEENLVLIDKELRSSFIYDWSGKQSVHKLSGSHNTQENFDNHRKYSEDNGNGKITPISTEKANYYYNLINNA